MGDKKIDQEFVKIVQDTMLDSEKVALPVLQELEIRAANKLASLLDDPETPPATALSTAKYVLGLLGYVEGTAKQDQGMEALLKKFAAEDKDEVEVTEAAKERLQAAKDEAEQFFEEHRKKEWESE